MLIVKIKAALRFPSGLLVTMKNRLQTGGRLTRGYSFFTTVPFCPICFNNSCTAVSNWRSRPARLSSGVFSTGMSGCTVDRPSSLASVAARGDRLHSRSVGTGSGLGQSPRADLFASGQRRHVFFAQLFTAVLKNVIRAKRIVRGERQADRPVDARDLFDYRGVFHITHPRAAVLFGKEHAHQSKLAHLCENLARQTLGLVPLDHMRFDLCFGEFTNRTFDLQLLLGQIKSHRHPNSSSFN